MENENKENLPEHLRQEVDEAEKEAVARMEIEYELRNNVRYKEFFAAYHPDDIEEFIKAYARRKVTWINWGRFYYEHNEDHQLRFYNMAQSCLWQIQQKKLFNLQCQWRAEKIKIPGITTTMDFRYWEYNVKQCNFVPPITQWEFDLYLEYIQNDDAEIDPAESDYEFEWQDYLRFTDEYNNAKEGEELVIPLWYQFYDNRMGTDKLMTLTDTRGEKESKYLKVYYEHLNKTAPDEKTDIAGTAKKEGDEYLSVYNPNIIEKFVRSYEEKDILKYFLSYEKSHKPMEFADELAELAFKELKELSDIVPIRACTDWRDAMIEAWENYRRKQIQRLLPLVYEDYLQKQELGISYENEDSAEINEELDEWKVAITKGRELSGEPGDFNF
ncbi:MAG: hypothetical protein ACLQQ4_01790 [Bacteroidia bacterium]